MVNSKVFNLEFIHCLAWGWRTFVAWTTSLKIKLYLQIKTMSTRNWFQKANCWRSMNSTPRKRRFTVQIYLSSWNITMTLVWWIKKEDRNIWSWITLLAFSISRMLISLERKAKQKECRRMDVLLTNRKKRTLGATTLSGCLALALLQEIIIHLLRKSRGPLKSSQWSSTFLARQALVTGRCRSTRRRPKSLAIMVLQVSHRSTIDTKTTISVMKTISFTACHYASLRWWSSLMTTLTKYKHKKTQILESFACTLAGKIVNKLLTLSHVWVVLSSSGVKRCCIWCDQHLATIIMQSQSTSTKWSIRFKGLSLSPETGVSSFKSLHIVISSF